MNRKIISYDTYQVFFTINFERDSVANKLKTISGISISNYLKTSNGIKYYNPYIKKYCIVTDEITAVAWVKSLYYYNPINEIFVLPDNFIDDGKHELIINKIDAGICNDRDQFTMRKSICSFKA
jgi:hypothetical protein